MTSAEAVHKSVGSNIRIVDMGEYDGINEFALADLRKEAFEMARAKKNETVVKESAEKTKKSKTKKTTSTEKKASSRKSDIKRDQLTSEFSDNSAENIVEEAIKKTESLDEFNSMVDSVSKDTSEKSSNEDIVDDIFANDVVVETTDTKIEENNGDEDDIFALPEDKSKNIPSDVESRISEVMRTTETSYFTESNSESESVVGINTDNSAEPSVDNVPSSEPSVDNVPSAEPSVEDNSDEEQGKTLDLVAYLRNFSSMNQMFAFADLMVKYSMFFSLNENNGPGMYSEIFVATDRLTNNRKQLIDFCRRNVDVYKRSLAEITDLIIDYCFDDKELHDFTVSLRRCMR